jgi:hypothetical protein
MVQPVVNQDVLRDKEVKARVDDLAECLARTAIRHAGGDPEDSAPEYVDQYTTDLAEALEQGVWLIPHETYAEWAEYNERAHATRGRAA